MGVTTNSLHLASAPKGPLQLVKKPNAMTNLSRHATDNLMKGSNTTPIITECRDISLGIMNGDLQKATFNGALISMPFLTASLSSKVTLNSAVSGAAITAAAVSGAGQTMSNINSGSSQVMERTQNSSD